MTNGKNYTVKSGDTLSEINAENPDLGYSSWQELRDANIEEILRVGRSQIAGFVGPDITRGPPCGIPGHTAPRHLISGGVHYDEPEAPTIYPGTMLYLKNKSEPPESEEETPQAEEGEEMAFTANEIHKDQWEGVEYQAPAPKLEIFTKWNPDTPDITYSADLQAGVYAKLLSYVFSESVDDLEGSFSFTVENEEINQDGLTVFDIIPNRSVVKIYEGGDYPAFVGMIRRCRLGVAMTSQGVRRTITFIGKSIISCIAEYTISLDVRIQGVADAISKTKDLEVKLARDNLTIMDFVKESWNHFKEVSENSGVSTTGLAEIINKFIGKVDDFVTVSGKEKNLSYNIATIFYNASNNVIADVWRGILPKPVYEIFSFCDKADGKPKIMVRQVPYGDPDNDDWKNLDIYLISPISLTSYDLDRSDEEVYTAFASYIIGSAMSKEFYMAVNQTGADETVSRNVEKQKIYGFKPLEISFVGYDRQGNTKNEKIDSLTETLKKLNERAAYWYSRLDDMYTGSITICTDFNHPETNPRVGCRAKFMGGEFYINKTDHAWNYGGTPTIKLTVSRGLMYDENGKIRDGEDGIIKNVGRRFRELERENA